MTGHLVPSTDHVIVDDDDTIHNGLVTFSHDPERNAEILALATAEDPNTVYLLHHYGRDDWHGAGTPYRTLQAALEAAINNNPDYGPWVDAAEIYASAWFKTNGGYPLDQEPNTLWHPVKYDDDIIDARDIGDDHPYIEKARIRS
jgi:hypothetical protein